METLIKADIFFFITSISVILVTLGMLTILYYVIMATRSLYKLAEKLQNTFRDSEDFVLDLKERLESNLIFRVLFPAMNAMKRRRKAKSKTEESSEEM